MSNELVEAAKKMGAVAVGAVDGLEEWTRDADKAIEENKKREGNQMVTESTQKVAAGKLKTFGEVSTVGKSIDFYEDLSRIEPKDLLGRQFQYDDVKIISGWSSDFNDNSSFALVKVTELDTGLELTSILGGRVVMKQLQAAKAGGQLPLLGTLRMTEGGRHGGYYILE